MKKTFFMTMVLLTTIACDNVSVKYGQGGKHACQFVREQVPELREDIESIEVISEDSLLSDFILFFEERKFMNEKLKFMKEEISKDEFKQIIDDRAKIISDVEDSWLYSTVVNDSLRKLDKYKGVWRKVYNVRLTMKSGVTKESRVLMDNDGVTPRMMEGKFGENIQKYQDEILEANNVLRDGF